MDLSIIIVNWNSKEYLSKCLASIYAYTDTMKFEIIVIDSGSYDGCGEMLRHCYREVRFLQSDKNLGFARANNIAFQASRGEWVLFLNPDTELSAPTIDIMYRHLRTLPNPGAVGCRLLNSDGSLQTSCIQAFPTILNQLLDAEALRQRFPRSRLWGTAPLFEQSLLPVEVDAVSGACLMIERTVFEKVGLFDTRYFMYSEDIDLCFKTKGAGLKNYHIPSAVVVHHGGGSAAKTTVNTFASLMMVESLWRFFLINRSLGYGCLYRVALLLASLVRIACVLTLSHLDSNAENDMATWETTFLKWKSRLQWSVGLASWPKTY